MIAAAAEALPDTRIAAVTVLTSMSAEDLDLIGLAGPPDDAAVRLAALAVEAGRARDRLLTARGRAGPGGGRSADHAHHAGVRPAGGQRDDQVRVATPEQALADGADLLVIGRPITGAADPGEAAAAIAASLRP